MKQIIRRANQKIPIGWAAALLAGTSFISMALGLLRERLLLGSFGLDSIELDAYRAAFKVPDFMFFILVSGALSVTFIPVLKDRLENGNKKSAWELSTSLLNFMALTTGAASLIIMIFADPIVRYVVAPGMPEEGVRLAVDMMRIIAINPFLFAISSVLTSIQQAVGRFFFFALAPSIYNLGIIFGVSVLSQQHGIKGVAYGVVIGSLLQLLVGAIGMIGLAYRYSFNINWRNLGFRRVLELLPARSLDQGMDYFLSLIEINRASRLAIGTINRWETAFTLHFVPINLIGIAISTAAFPQMTERLAQGRPDLFKKELRSMLRIIVWLALGAVVVAFFGRGYLIRLLVGTGDDVMSDLLALLSASIFFRAVFHILSRAFYAQQDTKTPLKISLFAITLNIILAFVWARPGAVGGLDVYGLALAHSVVSGIEVILLLFVLQRRFSGGILTTGFVTGVVRMFFAAALSSSVTYFLIRLFPVRVDEVGFFSLIPEFSLIVLVSLASYLGFSYMLGISESNPVIRRLVKIVYKPLGY